MKFGSIDRLNIDRYLSRPAASESKMLPQYKQYKLECDPKLNVSLYVYFVISVFALMSNVQYTFDLIQRVNVSILNVFIPWDQIEIWFNF